ncbi:hypothetical protein [Aquirhabdus sp.]|uniref:hypothetical protein n=1 Tax=Aquirhabdus sp. TaxID=2824160 RepID=UPI00396C5F89
MGFPYFIAGAVLEQVYFSLKDYMREVLAGDAYDEIIGSVVVGFISLFHLALMKQGKLIGITSGQK